MRQITTEQIRELRDKYERAGQGFTGADREKYKDYLAVLDLHVGICNEVLEYREAEAQSAIELLPMPEIPGQVFDCVRSVQEAAEKMSGVERRDHASLV